MPEGLNAGGQPRVLMTTDAVGGVWRYTLDLAAGFAERGVPTLLAVLGPEPSQSQRAEAAAARLRLVQTGLPLDWTAEGPADLAHATAGLIRLAAEAGAASVHLHAPALVGQGQEHGPWPAPVVAVAHSCVATWWQAVRGGPMPPDFRWRTAAAAEGLRRAAAVIAPSAAHAAALQQAYGPVPVRVVHNGAPFRQRENKQRPRAILTAGRLWDEGKGVAALDRVAPHVGAPVRAAGPINGPNGEAISLPNLDLLGTLDLAGMAGAFARASVFCSMARYEPFGLAVLEAARAGMRLVLSDIPSFRELWDGAATLVANEAALLPALRAALDQPGDGGAQERAARYTIDAMVRATLDTHRSVGACV